MESGYELSIPDATTPIKLEANGDSILCSSPSLQSGGDISSMISTGGTPIASLKTPTKVLISQSAANKHSMALSPTRLYVKQDIGGYSAAASTAVPSIASAVQAAPVQQTSMANTSAVYHGSGGGGGNNKLQYVRIVSSQAGDGVTTAPRQVMSTHMRPKPPLVPINNMDHMQLANNHMQQQQQQQLSQPIANRQIAGNTAGQRVLLPAGSSQTLRIAGSQSLAQIKSQLPPGTTILSSSDSSGQMLAFLPTSHTVIQKAPAVKQLYQGANQTLLRAHEYNPLAADAAPLSNGSHTAALNVNSSSSDANKQKKPCNCTKSQCLKLYCDCFANGEFCSNCNCQNCYNNLDHEEERQKAVKQCLERNPLAFHPKIGKSAKADSRRHQKGCNCKRSGCLKNYCECYEAKIPCGSMCKCVGCKNCEGHDNKGLMHLADAADLRHSQLTHTSHDQTSFVPETPAPHTYLKKPVIDAVIDCLIAQCREAENAKCKDSTTEKVILEEFGRCLSELIKASSQCRR